MTEEDKGAEIEFDRNVLGQVLGERDIIISQEIILRYCKAIGETNPKYTEPGPEQIAPPGICTILEAPQGDVEIKIPFANTRMHAGSAIFSYEPIRAGEKLKATVKLADVFTKTGRSGPMGFIIYENEFVREDGTVVARIQDTRVARP